jgi:hypothetical protein
MEYRPVNDPPRLFASSSPTNLFFSSPLVQNTNSGTPFLFFEKEVDVRYKVFLCLSVS